VVDEPGVVGSSAVWAVGGAALGRVVDNEQARRVITVGLAGLLVASGALIWV
jgi:hypothetical protein